MQMSWEEDATMVPAWASRKLLNMAAASAYVPKVSGSHPPSLWETLQDWQLGLAQAFIKLLFMPWV